MPDYDEFEIARENYWNKFYRAPASTLRVPSQFALFVLGELDKRCSIIDIGCGTGRDALYFSSHGHRVVGIDASASAVAHSTKMSTDAGLEAKFFTSAVNSPTLFEDLECTGVLGGPVCVYARFFVHAITDDEEQAFLQLASQLCGDDGLLAVEFRTPRDAQLSKVTSAHYRRFVDPIKFIHACINHGFASDYFVEGFGYAKYMKDDAHVARCILRKTRSAMPKNPTA